MADVMCPLSMTMMYWIEETGDVRLGSRSGDVGGVIEGG